MCSFFFFFFQSALYAFTLNCYVHKIILKKPRRCNSSLCHREGSCPPWLSRGHAYVRRHTNEQYVRYLNIKTVRFEFAKKSLNANSPGRFGLQDGGRSCRVSPLSLNQLHQSFRLTLEKRRRAKITTRVYGCEIFFIRIVKQIGKQTPSVSSPRQ